MQLPIKSVTKPACSDAPLSICPLAPLQCAPGFYARKGSKQPCQQCLLFPARTTADNPKLQRTIEDCIVAPGYGVVSGSDAFDVDTTSMNTTELAALPVLQCPVGWFGAGNTTGAKCERCDGTSTLEAGASSAEACSGELE